MNDTIEIIEYNNIHKRFTNEQIHDFININMHRFIGRELKQRIDVINIEDYYIKNGGNFWIAIDKEKNIIVGTIALENRINTGILKRLYVDENYQKKGIAQKLYNILEDFVLNKTNIKTLYLACGKVLKDAHRFYKKQGFIQTKTLEINMHVAEDDDFFKKSIC